MKIISNKIYGLLYYSRETNIVRTLVAYVQQSFFIWSWKLSAPLLSFKLAVVHFHLKQWGPNFTNTFYAYLPALFFFSQLSKNYYLLCFFLPYEGRVSPNTKQHLQLCDSACQVGMPALGRPSGNRENWEMRKVRTTTDFSEVNHRGRETRTNGSESLNLISVRKRIRGKKVLSFTQISSVTGQELSRQSLLQSHVQPLL